jgi:hypothetical protein
MRFSSIIYGRPEAKRWDTTDPGVKGDEEKMKRKVVKIVGWTLGMTVAVFLMTDGKTSSDRPVTHALIGAAIGFMLGLIFSRKVKTVKDETTAQGTEAQPVARRDIRL